MSHAIFTLFYLSYKSPQYTDKYRYISTSMTPHYCFDRQIDSSSLDLARLSSALDVDHFQMDIGTWSVHCG